MFGWVSWQWRKLVHKHTRLSAGNGVTGPHRNVVMRCCMCGKRRLFSLAYEMYGEDGGWWHACPECATSELARQIESAGVVAEYWQVTKVEE